MRAGAKLALAVAHALAVEPPRRDQVPYGEPPPRGWKSPTKTWESTADARKRKKEERKRRKANRRGR